ncbi:MarR family winged helix-turn-helix transcriptional regulator [Gordonia terrae]
MTDWLDDDEHRTWRSVLRMHAQLTAALAQDLRSDSDISIADYEVLAILSEAPEGRLQALDLRCELQWEKSRLAHQLRRMEERGVVRREACADDRRAQLVGITENGQTILRRAAPAHVERVRELFFNALTPSQLVAMRQAAEAVLDNLRASRSDDQG